MMQPSAGRIVENLIGDVVQQEIPILGQVDFDGADIHCLDTCNLLIVARVSHFEFDDQTSVAQEKNDIGNDLAVPGLEKRRVECPLPFVDHDFPIVALSDNLFWQSDLEALIQDLLGKLMKR